MTTIAYIANEFPSPLEPYVTDEITELRRRGARVICCSGKRVSPTNLSLAERAFWKETRFFQPLSDDELVRAARRLASDRHNLWHLLQPLIWDRGASPARRIRTLGHTLVGATMAEQLAPLAVEHIHAHHGYFASWMALAAARLLGIGFSFTLHGSDLLQRADLLSAKLRACQFCVTVSDFNRQYILRSYPATPAEKIIVQRLGVDCVLPWPEPTPAVEAEVIAEPQRLCLLSVGRLHRVKDHRFLIQACAALRDQSLDFICWIVGEGPERPALESQIAALGLQGRVHLIGHVPRTELQGYYRYADLVVMTSKSEGIPVALMEAMAHEKLVLAPAITGIPELVEHQRTGFLYQPGSLPDFVSAVSWIQGHKASLGGMQRAAAASTRLPIIASGICALSRSNSWPAFPNRKLTMRILYCNKYDYPFSGTERHLFDLIHQMDERGHETALFSMAHGRTPAFAGRGYRIPYLDFKDPNAGLLKKVKMAAHALYSPSARRAMRSCLADFSPDLAHVRGIYHHLSPSILWELKHHEIPVLYHLNDFKILCPTYNFVAEGSVCELCRHGAFHHVITRGCYTGPRSSAVVLAAEAYLHKWLRTYERCVDLFLAPSEFVRDKLIASGFPAQRIEVLPHFQALPGKEDITVDEEYLLYFGRLSAEKGVDQLLRAMARLPHIPIVIAGDGPERARLESLAKELNLSQVLFAGMVQGEKLQKLIAGCSFSVFPSHAYETLGKSILESYAWEKPVIASDLGSRRELVQHGVTGLLYPDGHPEQLAHSIAFLFDRPDLIQKMGAAARSRAKANHDPDQYMEKLLGLYSRLTSAKKPLSFPAALKLPSPRRSVRVAFIGGRGLVSKYSGVEAYYEQAWHELACLGHEVTVYCRTYFTPPISTATHNGMRVRRLLTIRSKHLETFVHTLLSTAHAMTSDYDVVHYQCLGPALFSFLPRLAGKKTVVTVQGLDWQRGKWGRIVSRILRWGEAAAVSSPDATMVVSRTLQQYYRQQYSRDTIYVPNGATLATRRLPRQLTEWDLLRDNYVLFLGRFSPEKNCHLLINAFERLNTGMKLVLAGGSSGGSSGRSSHSDSYAKSLRRHESDRIRFLPWVSGSNLEELLSNAALFVLPSEIEGLSLALLDAMAAGVCVLTSDIPENNEVVEGAGFTFRRGDQADLERMLDMLVHSPELRRQSAAQGRERIQQQYLWPAIARSIEKAYYKVLGWGPSEHLPSEILIRTSTVQVAPLGQVLGTNPSPTASA